MALEFPLLKRRETEIAIRREVVFDLAFESRRSRASEEDQKEEVGGFFFIEAPELAKREALFEVQMVAAAEYAREVGGGAAGGFRKTGLEASCSLVRLERETNDVVIRLRVKDLCCRDL